jgi:hypothetical protein
MDDDKLLFIYAEAPPLCENVVTHGLNRAASPMLRAIRDAIDVIALFPYNRHFRVAMLDPALAPLCTTPPRAISLLRAALRRLGRAGRAAEALLAEAIAAPQAAGSDASQIFCLEGSDPEVLPRIARIAARARKPFSVYVVDDFLIPMRLEGEPDCALAAATARARDCLQQARHVFAISDGLGALFEKNFGVQTVTLPLVFEPGPPYREPVKNQVIFVGSVNFLYATALRELIAAVGELRIETGTDLTIRFTSPSASSLGALPHFVHVAPLDSAESLAREIAASLFAFLPYSFEPQVADMVRTSFPSKLMEYLAYARSILVFAPEYASSSDYFRNHALPELVHDDRALRQAIARHLRESPQHSDAYRRQLSHIHSPDAARRTILSTLFGPGSWSKPL